MTDPRSLTRAEIVTLLRNAATLIQNGGDAADAQQQIESAHQALEPFKRSEIDLMKALRDSLAAMPIQELRKAERVCLRDHVQPCMIASCMANDTPENVAKKLLVEHGATNIMTESPPCEMLARKSSLAVQVTETLDRADSSVSECPECHCDMKDPDESHADDCSRRPSESHVYISTSSDGWRVRFAGRACAPSWQSRGPARAYLDALIAGTRQPEYAS